MNDMTGAHALARTRLARLTDPLSWDHNLRVAKPWKSRCLSCSFVRIRPTIHGLESPVLPVTAFDQVAPSGGLRSRKLLAGPSMSRRAASKPSRATHKSGRASAQAVWLRRRRSSINEPIASPPSATTGMTKRALRIVPPHCRSDGKSTAAGNLNHLCRPDGSCLAGWRAARNSRWGEFSMTATPDDRVRARPCACAPALSALRGSVGLVKTSSGASLLAVSSSRRAGAGTRRAPR